MPGTVDEHIMLQARPTKRGRGKRAFCRAKRQSGAGAFDECSSLKHCVRFLNGLRSALADILQERQHLRKRSRFRATQGPESLAGQFVNFT